MKNAASLDQAKRWLVNAGTLVSGGLGLYGLGAWLSGNWGLVAYGNDTVPMAPGTAMLLVLLSGAVGLRHRGVGRPVVRALLLAAAGIAALVSTLVCIQNLAGFDLLWEHLLARTDAIVRGVIPVGHMSPYTAAVFLGAVLGLLTLIPPMVENTWVRRAGALAVFLGALYSVVVALAYATDTPFFYSGATVPMAFLTAIALAALNLALLAEDGTDVMWRSVRFVDFPAATWRQLSPAAWRLAIVAAVAMTGIVLTGILYLRALQATRREKIAQELAAIADLKVKQIVDWKNERRNDARFLMRAPFVAKDVAAFFAQPDSAALRAGVAHWLELMKGGLRYETVILFDGEAHARLILPEGTGPPDPKMRERVEAALRTKDISLSELYANEAHQDIHLDLFAPIFAPGEQPVGAGGASQVLGDAGLADMGGTPMPRSTGVPPVDSATGVAEQKTVAPTSGQPIAVILLELNPRSFLYPLIQDWPMPSETAETLLVRREGDEIVFLNELRHRAGTALKLRRSIREQQLPAARVARGEAGVQEGVDYRGVPVLADTRAIPDSPWFIVAKVDQAEIYAPLRRQAWTVGSVMAALLLAAAAGVGMLWRQQAAQQLHRELVAERERKALAERLALVMRHANDIILLLDDRWRIVEANDRAFEAYGYTLDELRQKTVEMIRPSETRGDFPAQSGRLLADGNVVFATVHQRKDGTTFPVEVSSRLVELEGVSFRLSIIRDITQRRAHEREIERMNRLYAALSQVNQAVVHTNTRQELFDEVCRVMVEFGRFRMTWIGRHNEAERQVRPLAWAGEGARILEGLQIFTDERAEAQSPAGTAVREERGDVCNDFAADPRMAPWRDRMEQHGFRSAAAFPIRCRGRVWGSLTVYTAEAGFFHDKEVALLDEATGDISFALDRLEDLAEHQQVEAALRESEKRFHSLFENMGEITAFHELVTDATGQPTDYRILDVNRAYVARLGIPRERAVGALASVLYAVEPPPYLAEYAAVAQTGVPRQFETEFAPMQRYFHISVAPAGPGRFATITTDITEAKQAEAALLDSEARFRTVVEQAPEAIFIQTQGILAYLNPAALRLYGATSSAQLIGQPMLDRVHPYFRESIRERLRLLNEERQAVPPAEQVHLRLDGQPVSLHVAAVPFTYGGKAGALVFATDITERKQAEEALRLSQLKFETLFRTGLDLNFISDVESGKIVEANDAFCAAFGNRETVLGRSMADLRLWPAEEAWQDFIKSLRAGGGKVRNFAARLRLGTGELRDFLLTGQSLTFEGQEYVFTIGRDITELRQAERERTLLANTLAASLNEIFLFDADTWRFIFVNDGALLNLGYTLPQMQWMTPLDLAPDFDRAAFERLVGPLARHEKPVQVFETRHRRADGSYYPVEVHLQLFEAESGRVYLAVIQDITERQRAEETLRRERNILDRITLASPVGIIMADGAGQLVYANPQAEEILGLTRKEITRRAYDAPTWHITDLAGNRFPEEQLPFRRVMTTAQPAFDVQHAIEWPDGRRVALSINAAPLFNEAGQVDGMVAVIQDITERKQAEQKLRDSEYFLRKSQEVTQLGSYNFDLMTGKWIGSPTLDKIFGIDDRYPKDANGWLELVVAEQRQEMDQHLKRVLGGRHRFEKEYRIVRPNDRQVRWVFGLGELEFDENGKTLRMIGTIQDITERKETATALQNAKEFAENLIRTANTMIVWLDANGHIVLFNEAAEEITGYTRAELEGKNWFEVLVPRARYPEVWTEFARLLNGGTPVRFENPILTKAGEERFIVWQNNEVYEEGRIVGTISFGMDVTERRRAEEEVRQLNAELEQRVLERTAALEAANNELEAFSYSVSHDLRAPLRAIDGFTRILEEDYAKVLDPEGRRVLGVIGKEGQRMGQLIDDLLAFSRLGRRALQPAEIDLTALAREVFQKLSGQEKDRRVKLKLAPLPPAQADPSLLRQVLINLLGNAIKYTRPRDVAQIEIGGSVQGSEHVYYIKDNGAGFDMQYADKLFGVFQRLHSESEFEGTGVGLALVQRIIRRHGGRVWAEGKVDQGATFFFTLPTHNE